MRTAVTGLGMVCSLGRDAATACAAIRAGLRLTSEIEELAAIDAEEDDPTPLRVHQIRGYTDGFLMFGRWMRLAEGCFSDLLHHGGVPAVDAPGFWRDAGLMLVTPPLDPERFQWGTPTDEQRVKAVYGERLLRLLDVAIPPHHVEIISLGHAGTARAVQRAAELLEAARLQRVVVLAVDSYVDPLSLEWLGLRGRLKGPDNPVGLSPGEAGACFLLEREEAARLRGAAVQAWIVGAETGVERASYLAGQVSTGAGLAGAIASVLGQDAGFRGDLIADCNGEPWRARELAAARANLAGRIHGAARLLLPAASIGEVGAASGASAVCLAVRSFLRGAHRGGGEILVLSSSEHGHVGAVRIREG